MLYQYKGKQSPSMKACYYKLWVVFTVSGKRSWFFSKGTKEKGAYFLSQYARKGLGKIFTKAMLIDRRINKPLRIWTLEDGEQTVEERAVNKKIRQSYQFTPSLLRMSMKMAYWTNESKALKAEGKQPYINFFSDEVDVLTGDVGVNVAMERFYDILEHSKWMNRYDYANIRYKKDKKIVAKIYKDLKPPTILCEEFYKIVNNN